MVVAVAVRAADCTFVSHRWQMPLYLKSHSNFDPGEQKHRGYSWVDKHGPMDPAAYRFGGIVTERDVDGMAKAMNPAKDDRIPKEPKARRASGCGAEPGRPEGGETRAAGGRPRRRL